MPMSAWGRIQQGLYRSTRRLIAVLGICLVAVTNKKMKKRNLVSNRCQWVKIKRQGVERGGGVTYHVSSFFP